MTSLFNNTVNNIYLSEINNDLLIRGDLQIVDGGSLE